MSNRSTLNTTHTYPTTIAIPHTPTTPTILPATAATTKTSSLLHVDVCHITCNNAASLLPWTYGFSGRLRQFCEQVVPARSRRRRAKLVGDGDDHSSSAANDMASHIITAAATTTTISSGTNVANSHPSTDRNLVAPAALTSDQTIDHNNNSYSCTSNNNLSKITHTPASQLFGAVTQALSRSSVVAYIAALLVLTTYCSLCAASPCDTHSWWDPVKDKCIECTVCQGELIPLRPCQLHRDTICGSIYDLKIDWVVLAKTEPNWKERRKENDNFDLEQQLTHDELQQLQDGSMPLDWQTTALFLAVLACLLFFIVAAGILVHHMRQWRRMERRLDQDVEELSTKLMAKLAEVQSLEGGTFFIGNAEALRVPTTFQPQHVLLPEKSTKHHERRILKTLQPGNVYIEESSSKG